MFDMLKLGKNISARRKALGITQMELADRLNISYQAVSNWERGQTCPDISKLGEISEILGCTTDELLGSRRTAEVIKQIEEEKPDTDVTTGELMDVAPILKPEQVDRTFGSLMEKLGSLGETISKKISDTLDGKKLGNEISRKARDTLGTSDSAPDGANSDGKRSDIPEGRQSRDHALKTLVRLAPYLPTETLNKKLRELGSRSDADIAALAALAPFADNDTVGEVAKEMFKRSGELSDIASIAPFMDGNDVGELAKTAIARGGKLCDIASVAPFMDGNDVGELAKTAIARGGELCDIASVAPFMDGNDLNAIVIDALGDGASWEDLMPILPFLGDSGIDMLMKTNQQTSVPQKPSSQPKTEKPDSAELKQSIITLLETGGESVIASLRGTIDPIVLGEALREWKQQRRG